MKFCLCVLLTITTCYLSARQSEKIDIPKGIVYKCCDTAAYEKAKGLVSQELSASPSCSLNSGILFTGPVLWHRYGKIKPQRKTTMTATFLTPARLTD
jgi:hypothetical protein